MLKACCAGLAALILVVTVVAVLRPSPHRSDRPAEAKAIARAMKAPSFRGLASIFPRRSGSRACEVRAGAPGNVYRGTCATSAVVDPDGSSTVTFTQNIGGKHTWVIAVDRTGRARVVDDSGAQLVEQIP